MCRSFILGTAAWLAAVGVAFAGSPGATLLTSKAAGPSTPAARSGALTINPCKSYGPNFARIEGTDTCVKLGGAARVEMGTSVAR